MSEPTAGYPHHLAGDPAPAPVQVERRVLGMALKAHAKHLDRVTDQLRGTGDYRRAYALDVLVAEADAADPGRSKVSDGWIGDARHQAENGPNGPGSGSDHNPWVRFEGRGIVRAEDLTNDPVLDLPAVAERIRLAAQAGRCPQVTGGGYVILAGRITAEDWSGWHVYTGSDPHVSHMHVSVSLAEPQFDSRAGWGVFTNEQPPAPTPTPPPAPPAPAGWTGPDLTGHGAGLRGQAAGQPQGPQSNGPRVKALQEFLNRVYPAYSHLVTDGWYGDRTAAVLAQFARREQIDGADGLNIGPKLAAALARAGFEQTAAAPPPAGRSAARDRVLRHLSRRDSR